MFAALPPPPSLECMAHAHPLTDSGQQWVRIPALRCDRCTRQAKYMLGAFLAQLCGRCLRQELGVESLAAALPVAGRRKAWRSVGPPR